MNRIFWGTLVCAALCACSKENPADNGKPVFLGDKAYLNVNIADASSLTRATSGDSDFEYGKDEHNVTDADFYFYDENGVFVTQAKAWNDGKDNEAEPDENIEYFGNSIIVLKGLSQKGFPKYLVTVLNAPTGFEPGNTLEEMQEKLSGGIQTTGKDFIMSTSSYVHADGRHFVTEVEEKYFKPEPVPDPLPEEVVQIYVERLAVKVTVKVDETQLKPVEGHPDTYTLRTTVAGNPNEGTEIGATDLYVKFLGWGLNATTKDSRMMKKIDATSWSDTKLGFKWNISELFRSYWGESYNYGKTDGAYGTAEAKYVNYIPVAQATIKMGASGYCAENTNSSAIVSDNNPSAITSVLLKAQLMADPDGTGELNLIRYNGLLYKESQYLDHVLDVLQKKGDLNVYYESAENTLTQIDKEYVELASNGDGTVYVKMKTTDTPLYKQITNESGDPDKEEITDMTDVNKTLKDFNAGTPATAYRGGLMYYNIRIEHLNNSAETTEEGKTVIPEAKYGVVRNHHYVVTINSLSKPGTGVFSPDEVIIPSEDPNKETYYVGAKINVLSWKIVNQNVPL